MRQESATAKGVPMRRHIIASLKPSGCTPAVQCSTVIGLIADSGSRASQQLLWMLSTLLPIDAII